MIPELCLFVQSLEEKKAWPVVVLTTADVVSAEEELAEIPLAEKGRDVLGR